jgi:probable extracellular repeat, HAF family
MIDLGTLGGNHSAGRGINNLGQVTGSSDIAGFGSHAFLYDGGSMIDLGTLGGSAASGNGINDLGRVAGVSRIAGDAAVHAFLYDGSGMVDLGTLGGGDSFGNAVNGLGQVVGYSFTTGSSLEHAFMYNGTSMVDLNRLINPQAGWFLNNATDINDAGQIVGNGIIEGQTHAFVLTPLSNGAVPEPAVWAMMIAGFGIVGGLARREGNAHHARPSFVEGC